MKKKIRPMLGVCLMLAGLICAGISMMGYQTEENAGEIYEELKEEVILPSSEQQIETETEVSVEVTLPESAEVVEEEKEPIEVPIDFDTLTEQYPDIYAWVHIPGTQIDYPIVQKEGDNAYYLKHTIDGEKKTEGSIFTEDYNSKDFGDPNTLIYGHNMKNGSMFRGLHQYKDRKFMEENSEVIIYMPEKILHYQIFAAYVSDNRHLLFAYDFNDPEVFEEYIDKVFTVKNMSTNVDTDVSVTAEDKIITLSTCNGNDNQRYLVQAVLLSIEE